MSARSVLAASLVLAASPVLTVTLAPAVTDASPPPVEISDDGRQRVQPVPAATDGQVIARDEAVPYGTEPDWQNDLRRQVGALQVADLDGDGWNDVVVGCYISNSYPPYEDWENLIYFNTGGVLEPSPSWVSADEVSTGDIQVADLDGDGHLDVFAANGGGLSAPSVVYQGGPDGPDPVPGWSSAEPDGAWNNHALPVDIDGDGDLDVVTANQGAGQFDPYRPLYLFENTGDGLQPAPVWQSAEASLQNFLAAGDWDQDGWPEVAVSQWSGFASGILDNAGGVLAGTPVWTTGDTDADKGVALADLDGDGWIWPSATIPPSYGATRPGAWRWSGSRPRRITGPATCASATWIRTATPTSPSATSPTAGCTSTSTAAACSTPRPAGPTIRPPWARPSPSATSMATSGPTWWWATPASRASRCSWPSP